MDRQSEEPYIEYVRSVAKGWPHVQYLADFMDETAEPSKNVSWRLEDAIERSSRTNIAILDFNSGGQVQKPVYCKNTTDLKTQLENEQDKANDVIARLFIVEDLSRDVIEILGARFDIDPRFFRGQISDFLWHNPRDPWTELSTLDMITRKRSFFNIPYFQARYFQDQTSIQQARKQADAFNVMRRMDSNFPWEGTKEFDKIKSEIALVRSKISLWVRRNNVNQKIVLGIMLVDPTISEGFPLWGGYENFDDCPSMKDFEMNNVQVPPRTSVFDETIFWTSSLSSDEVLALLDDSRLFIKKALFIVCAEWKTIINYLTTRLTQLEWELNDTKDIPSFRNPNGLEKSLGSLNTWRRRMPVYQEWVSQTLSRVINPPLFQGKAAAPNGVAELADDFQGLEKGLTAVMNRADRIESAIASIISIEESKKATKLNTTATRLSYLVVIFVPLSWTSGFYSMTTDVALLKGTFWVYFATAIPLTLLALACLSLARRFPL